MIKKEKILFILLCIISFFLVDTISVKAATSPYWGYDLEHFNDGQFYDCNSSNCNNSIVTAAQWGTDVTGRQFPGFFSGGATTVANSYGIMFITSIPNQPIFKGYLYALNTYVCSTGNSYPTLINYYFGSGIDIRSRVYSAAFKAKNQYVVNGRPYNSYGNSSGGGLFEETCGYMSSVFSLGNDFPSPASDSIGIQFTTTSTQTAQYWVVGYSFDNLGYIDNLSSSDVQNVIDKSGLATASDVESVKSSVNEVKKDINELNQTQKETNNILKDDDVTDSTNQAGDFFNGFTTDTHGLTAIITAPLSLIERITSSSCSPLVLPLPYVDKDLTLPCMGAIYSNYFGSFLSIYQLITFGIVAYWVCVRIFNLVKDFKNPDHDEIEVLDL